MCGVVGILSFEPESDIARRLADMQAAQRHRGPDGEGTWVERVGDAEVALGHARLSILDLTEAGRQPMFAGDGRYVLVYNGEVYNYRELGEELAREGVELTSHCDTEVVLQALIRWGRAAFSRFNGMWALAFVDRREKKVLFARDRFGIKPLYLHRRGTTFFFASEIKSILAGARATFDVNARIVGAYLGQALLDFDLAHETFFEGVTRLPPGHSLEIDLARPSAPPSLARFYTPPTDDRFEGNVEQRIEQVRATFLDAVRLRLRSDVPVGVTLSGGVDSSSIAVAMQHVLGKDADLHLVSAVSDDPSVDEQPFIDRVARHLGKPVHKVRIDFEPARAFGAIERVTWNNDEPILSFSFVAHYLLMEEARKLGVTVILSGQGADELLCGYLKYLGFHLQALVRGGHPASALRTLIDFTRQGTVLRQFEVRNAKRYLPRVLKPKAFDIRGPRVRAVASEVAIGLGRASLVERQRADLERFSVPALVHYEDRMSMAFGREIRLPFLDYRMVDLLLPTPPELKLRDGYTKWIFRRAMDGLLPPEIAWRKDKKGFTLPDTGWLQTSLRPEIERMLAGGLLSADLGLVDRDAVRARYAAFCAQGARGTIASRDVFSTLALEVWLRTFAKHIGGVSRRALEPEPSALRSSPVSTQGASS